MAEKNGAPTVGIPESNEAQISTSLSIFVGNEEIGFIESFAPSSTRTIQRLRELSASSGGRVIEMVPHTEDSRITISGYCIYKEKAQYLFKRVQPDNVTDDKTFISLMSQRVPFDIVEKATHPGRDAEVVMVYAGCWCADWSKSVNIANAIIGENLTVEVQAIVPRIGA